MSAPNNPSSGEPEVIAPNLLGIPPELRALPRWVAWRIVPPKEPGGKFGKQPINPRSGQLASSTDPATWGTFDESIACVRDRRLAGIGFVFTLEDGVVGTDLDHCRDPKTGVIDDWARTVIARLASYTEISPSGTGVHIFARGKLPAGGRKKSNVEMYDSARFFTMTGVLVDGPPTEVADRSNELAAYHAEVFGDQKARTPEPKHPDRIVGPDDEELLDRALSAKNGDKFARLWSGDTEGYPSPSEAELALCGMLVFWTCGDASRIDALFRKSSLMRDKWDEKRGERTHGQRTIAKALEGKTEFYKARNSMARTPASNGAEPGVTTSEANQRKRRSNRRASREQLSALSDGSLGRSAPTYDERRKIILIRGELPTAIDEAVAALATHAKRMLVFQRADILVRIIASPRGFSIDPISRSGPQLRVRARDAHAMADLLDRVARFVVLVQTEAGWGEETIDCPLELARKLLSRQQWPDVPVLTAIVETPTMLADGRILDRDGYDDETGIFVALNGLTIPTIPEQPTDAEARSALAVLLDLLREFRFATAIDRAVALASLLVPFAREIFDNAPLIGLDAPVAGSGKSALAEIPALLATGRAPRTMPQPRDEVEARKRIFALLLEGHRVLSIDNVSTPLEGETLCIALTQAELTDRVLGETKTASAPTRHACWSATGNNLTPKGDIRRRVLICRLDSGEERPASRRYERELRRYTLEHRGEFVAAALLILRWRLRVHAERLELRPFGSYEGWSQLIRAALVELGESDPVDALDRNEETDPETTDLRILMVAWEATFGSRSVTAPEAVRVAGSAPVLRDALELVAASRAGKADNRSLGTYLRQVQRRPLGGRRFEKAGQRQHWALWRLVPTPGAMPVSQVNVVSQFPASTYIPASAGARARPGARAGVKGSKATHDTHHTHNLANGVVAESVSSDRSPEPDADSTSATPMRDDSSSRAADLGGGDWPATAWDDGGDQ